MPRILVAATFLAAGMGLGSRARQRKRVCTQLQALTPIRCETGQMRDPKTDVQESSGGARVSFRDDGAAALAWVEHYFETLRERPVLARVKPGEIRSRLPASAPEEPEPFAAVLSDLDAVLMPGFTHWQSPRFFAYFRMASRARPTRCAVRDCGRQEASASWHGSSTASAALSPAGPPTTRS
jgi:hypothetical protein